jgi:hypothetical protein
MVKLLVGALLALTAANSMAGNLYIHKDQGGQVLLTNVNPSGGFNKFTNKVEVTYYRNGSSTNANYANSSYDELRGKTSTPNKNVQKVIKPIEKSKTLNTGIKQLSFEVPEGYRLPTKNDVFGDWERFDAPNHLKADFNSDGIEDEAYILPRKGSDVGYGAFVSMSKVNKNIQAGHEFQMFKLIYGDMSPQSFAIELAEPSNETWKTACGKGYWDCGIDEPDEIKITRPSIMFCYIESACHIYLLGEDRESFKKIALSD